MIGMEKIIVDFEEVRGRGNIVSPPKSLEDYIAYSGIVSEDTDSVMGLESRVFCLVYSGEGVSIVVSGSFVRSTESLTVTATVLDENGDPIEGASVELFKEVN
jgi:protocatechuate 3,4-dioxygenase beta subunit